MKKQAVLEKLAKIGESVFGSHFVDVGVGGSCIGDIDVILIVSKFSPSLSKVFVNKAKKQMDKSVSVVLMTKMMFHRQNFWCDKFITMALKGINFFNRGYFNIDIDTAKRLAKPLIPEATYRLYRAYLDGKIDEDRLIDLLLQYLVLCQ